MDDAKIIEKVRECRTIESKIAIYNKQHVDANGMMQLWKNPRKKVSYYKPKTYMDNEVMVNVEKFKISHKSNSDHYGNGKLTELELNVAAVRIALLQDEVLFERFMTQYFGALTDMKHKATCDRDMIISEIRKELD